MTITIIDFFYFDRCPYDYSLTSRTGGKVSLFDKMSN